MQRDPDRPSIFSRPEADDPAFPEPDASGGLEAPLPAGEAVTTTSGDTHAGTRRLALLGGAALVLLVGAGFVGAALLGPDDNRGLAGASVTASPSPSATTSPEVSFTPAASSTPTASAAPTPEPEPASLAAAAWAEVAANAVNVRESPEMSGRILGSADRGDLVYIGADDPVASDGYRWYRVQAAPGLTGWAAAGPEPAPFLAQPAAGSRAWCGSVDAKVMDLSGPRPPTPSRAITVAGLAMPADWFTAASLGAAEIAWAGRTEVCAHLEIAASQVSSAELDVSLEHCGPPKAAGYPGWYLELGDPSVSPTDRSGRRDAWLDEPLLGFEMGLPFHEMPPMGQLIGTSGSFRDGETCFGGSVRGVDNELEATTRLCAFVGAIKSGSVELMWHDPSIGATDVYPIRLPGESTVDSSLRENAQQLVQLRTVDGLDAPMHVTRVEPDC